MIVMSLAGLLQAGVQPSLRMPFFGRISSSLGAMSPGSTVAIVTPMSPDGSVDLAAYEKLLNFHIDSGTAGLCVLGTTGEASVLSMEERASVLEVTRSIAGGKVPYMVGTGAIDPKKCIELSQQALDYGADASLVVTPYYVKPTVRGLTEHYRTIADSVPLDIVLYNVPGRTCCDMSTETVAHIKNVVGPRIVGIKEASGDVSRVAPLREACGKDFLMWSGDDETGAEFVLKGGDGVISVVANVAPKEMQDMIELCLEKKESEAIKMSAKLMPLSQHLFCQSNPIPVKYALNKLGLIGSGIRPPLHPLEKSFESVVEKALADSGLA